MFDFRACFCRIPVCRQSLHKILIIIRDESTQDGTNGAGEGLALFKVCITRKPEREPKISSCLDL